MSDLAPITLHFELTRDEYVEACRADARKQKQGRLNLHYGLVIFGAGILEWTRLHDSRDWGAPVLLMALGVAVLISRTWSAWSQMEKTWKESERHLQPTTVKIKDEGLEYETPLFRGEFRWAMFSEIVETQNLFLLYSGPSELHLMLPKRGLDEQARMGELARVLREKLSRIPGAFPVVSRTTRSSE